MFRRGAEMTKVHVSIGPWGLVIGRLMRAVFRVSPLKKSTLTLFCSWHIFPPIASGQRLEQKRCRRSAADPDQETWCGHVARPHLERAHGSTSLRTAERSRRHGGWRNASSSTWLLAAGLSHGCRAVTDQSLPEIAESFAPLGLVGSGGLFIALASSSPTRQQGMNSRRRSVADASGYTVCSLADASGCDYLAGTAIMSSVVVRPFTPTPRTTAFDAAGGRWGS